MAEQQTIIAEISKNYYEKQDHPLRPNNAGPKGNSTGSAADASLIDWEKMLLCDRFELVIEVNRKRGYRLESWQLNRVVTVSHGITCINETIVAQFELTLSEKLKRFEGLGTPHVPVNHG